MTETQPATARDDPGRAVPAIELTGVEKAYHAYGETVAAVRGVDLAIAQGSSSPCSDRPAAARRRPCAWSPGSRSRRRAGSGCT